MTNEKIGKEKERVSKWPFDTTFFLEAITRVIGIDTFVILAVRWCGAGQVFAKFDNDFLGLAFYHFLPRCGGFFAYFLLVFFLLQLGILLPSRRALYWLVWSLWLVAEIVGLGIVLDGSAKLYVDPIEAGVLRGMGDMMIGAYFLLVNPVLVLVNRLCVVTVLRKLIRRDLYHNIRTQ